MVFFISHIPHINLLQASAIIPWLFIAAGNLWEKYSLRNLLFFGFVLSQQVLAGFIQIVFISLLGVFLYLVSRMIEKNINELLKKIVGFSLAVVLGLVLAAPQLLPTLEYTRQSGRRSGLSDVQIF